MPIDGFRARFRYAPELAGRIGVERERFIIDKTGAIVPASAEVLAHIGNNYRGYARWPTCEVEPSLATQAKPELSACQIETVTTPCDLTRLRSELEHWDSMLGQAFADLGYRELHAEVAPADMPLDVYPDPSGRYESIAASISHEALVAACRVAGTHVHIGMPDHETALRVYNAVLKRFGELCELGNGSFGERLAIYRQMAPGYLPLPYDGWHHFYERAVREGFADDPRKCWTMIRISVHGTIEFRMFGATDSVARIVRWAERCHDLCMRAMNA